MFSSFEKNGKCLKEFGVKANITDGNLVRLLSFYGLLNSEVKTLRKTSKAAVKNFSGLILKLNVLILLQSKKQNVYEYFLIVD